MTNGRTLWADAEEADGLSNMAPTGYPTNRLDFVPDMVEETVPPSLVISSLCLEWTRTGMHCTGIF
jgi:hypothetical protein